MKKTSFCVFGPTDPGPEYKALIGIDWADKKHLYCLRCMTPAQEMETGSLRPAELSQWILELRQRFGPGKIAVALEDCRTALIYALAEHADFIDIYAIATAAAANYRESFVPSGAKSDEVDSQALQDMLYRHRDQYRRWEPDDAQTRLLDALCRQRRNAVNQRTRLGNQLLAKLKLCYPVAPALCDVSAPMMLALLKRWPTQDKLQAAKAACLKKFFYVHGVRMKKSIDEKLALIAAARPLLRDEAVLLPAQLEVACLRALLAAQLPAIIDYDERIAKLYTSHPDAFIFQSLPGAGKVLGPRLVCAMGSRRERWPSPIHTATASGIAPVRIASGQSCYAVRRLACPKYLRQSFHEFAASSLKFCPWAKQLHQRLMAKGKGYHTAVRTVAFRWIRIIWRIWQDRVLYNETIFTTAQQTHAQKAA